MPKDVDYRAQVKGARGGIGKREMRANGGEDSKLYYQERVVSEPLYSSAPNVLLSVF